MDGGFKGNGIYPLEAILPKGKSSNTSVEEGCAFLYP